MAQDRGCKCKIVEKLKDRHKQSFIADIGLYIFLAVAGGVRYYLSDPNKKEKDRLTEFSRW